MMASALARQLRPAFTSARRVQRQALLSTRASFQEGDQVLVKADGLFGTVEEVRGSGWYSIKLQSDEQRRKIRGSQIELLAPSATSAATEGLAVTMTTPSRHHPALSVTTLDDSVYDSSLPTAPPPTIVDLDAAVQSADQVERSDDAAYLRQVDHHLSYSKWVMFTDLHCAPASLDTCLKVLEHVHELAAERDAGILFLGDWWHHRGSIRVDTLNAVLEALSHWTQPMVMIPGNHDQVTLGGHNHGLTPLQHAYRCGDHPGPLIFSHPTIFAKALWVPHVRDNAVMESILQSPAAGQSNAVFCHADVTGASMNDLIVSQGGVLPRYFPAGVPVYSGHFHKPHVVTRSQVSIEYPGSPYETTLSEAHQQKSLLVLDSTQGWNCIERVGVNLGRKHFRMESVDDLLAKESMVRSGDRAVVSVPYEDLLDMRRNNATDCDFDATIASLRRRGAVVEVREIKTVPSRPLGPGDFAENKRQLEELTPEVTLRSYFTEEVNRESMSNTTSQELLKTGMAVLDEIDASDETPAASAFTNVELTSVSLQGFGPFKSPTTYPLLDRGLVLLRGSNKDGGSDSNGTGKSSLAMAALWALTGSVDPRLVNDGRVADVVTDGCKSAKVAIQGKLNGEDFRITRTKTSSKTGLVFFLGDKDLTTQSVRETQAVIEATLCADLQVLARTMFHGQHAINGLLEATDVKLKEELSCIVPLEIWQHAATFARTKARKATKSATELKGMIMLREDDAANLAAESDEALKELNRVRDNYENKKKQAEASCKELSSSSPDEMDAHSVRIEVDAALGEIEVLQQELGERKELQEKDVKRLQPVFDEKLLFASDARNACQQAQRDADRTRMMAESADKSLQLVQDKWNIDLTEGKAANLAIEKCPTCLQPLSMEGEGHSHDDLLKAFEEEAEAAVIESDKTRHEKSATQAMYEEACAALKKHEKGLKDAATRLDEVKGDWQAKLSDTEKRLESARSRHMEASTKLAKALSSMQTEAETQAIMTALEADQIVVDNAKANFDRLRSGVDRALEGLKGLNTQANEEKSKAVMMSSLADVFGAKGVQNFVLQNAVEALQTISQAYLDELSDGSIRLTLSLDDGDKIARRCFVRLTDGDFTERPLSSLSGGQWRRCSLSLCLGFVDLMARRGRLRPSLMVLDEPLTHLDRSGRSRVGTLLRKLLSNGQTIGEVGTTGISATTIVLILQDLAAEELEEAFDHIDEVVKTDGFSSVFVDESSS